MSDRDRLENGERDNGILVSLMARELERSGLKFRRQDSGVTRILSMGCGPCREANAIADFFAGFQSSSPTAVSFIGVDRRLKPLTFARRHFKSGPGRSFRFICEDGRELPQLAEIWENADVVMFRHQNYWHHKPAWKEMFSRSLRKLSPSGIMLVTSYFDEEHDLALGALRQVGARILSTARNDASRSLPVEGKSVDRHLAVVCRYVMT